LKAQRTAEWYKRFGKDALPFWGYRREEIQNQLKEDFDIEYSDGGMRGRLKKLVEKGKLRKFRLYERITFYSMTN